MKKFKIKKSFQNKNFKYGGMSAIISVIVIVALIFVNFLASKYDYKFDFTKNRLFSLSDQTYKVLKTVNSDIISNLRGVEIMKTALGYEAALLGAATLALQPRPQG